jgi:hypothetical protein
MTAHGEALRTESNDDPLVEGIKEDYTKLDLPAAERAMLDYAVKLTVSPATVGEADVQTLRAHGFDDPFGYCVCHLPLQFQRPHGRRHGHQGSRFSLWLMFSCSGDGVAILRGVY